jgi:hypothetical protein
VPHQKRNKLVIDLPGRSVVRKFAASAQYASGRTLRMAHEVAQQYTNRYQDWLKILSDSVYFIELRIE